MTVSRKRNSFIAKTLLALILILPLVCGLMQIESKADTSYYATWDDYKASGAPATTWNDVADAMDLVIDAGKELMAAGDYDGAFTAIRDAYYGYYETTGFERIAMGYISGSRKTEMELQFSNTKAIAKNHGSVDDFNAQADKLSEMLRTDANVLDGVSGDSSDSGSTDSSSEDTSTAQSGGTSAGTATFVASFTILLREGIEAILIVGAIIAYLKKSSRGDKKRERKQTGPVYIGAIIGIAASFGLAGLLNLLKLANTEKQEIIEGVTALIAVAVLVYVCSWMISHSEQAAWSRYIKNAAKKGGIFALAFTSFLAVFREGAEVVLFYQPLLAQKENIGSVWAGFFVAVACLVVIYFLINVLGAKLPLKPFFIAMSILMAIMAVSFIGAGLKELIEGDVFTPISPEWLQWIPYTDFLDVLGIYPILQTLLAQLLLTIFLVIMFVLQFKKNKALRLAAEAKERELKKIRDEYEAEVSRIEFENSIRGLVTTMVNNGEIQGDTALITTHIQEIPALPEALAEQTWGDITLDDDSNGDGDNPSGDGSGDNPTDDGNGDNSPEDPQKPRATKKKLMDGTARVITNEKKSESN